MISKLMMMKKTVLTHFILLDEEGDEYSMQSEVRRSSSRMKIINTIHSDARNDYPCRFFESNMNFLNLLVNEIPKLASKTIDSINANYGQGHFLMKFANNGTILILKLNDCSRKCVVNRHYLELNVKNIKLINNKKEWL